MQALMIAHHMIGQEWIAHPISYLILQGATSAIAHEWWLISGKSYLQNRKFNSVWMVNFFLNVCAKLICIYISQIELQFCLLIIFPTTFANWRASTAKSNIAALQISSQIWCRDQPYIGKKIHWYQDPCEAQVRIKGKPHWNVLKL